MSGAPRTSRSCDCLIVTTADNIGGMERIACALARGLAARFWRVRTMMPAGGRLSGALEWFRGQGVDAEASDAILDASAPHTLRGVWTMRHLLRRERPRVVCLNYGSTFLSLKDVTAVRLAATSRCVAVVHGGELWEALGEQKRWLTRIAARLSDAVVCVSEATRRLLRDAEVPERKLRVIPDGIRVPDRIPGRLDARAHLGLPRDVFIVASLARLVPGKGIADLITAVERLPERDSVVLLVGGEGPERRALQALAAERLDGRAVFLGFLAGDTAEFFAAADVFVLPSYSEGFGLSFIEAALHGVPGVGTRVGGIPEAIVDGETGLLVPPGDVAALAAAITRLRADGKLRARLGAAARARAQAQFSETRMVDRYEELFRSLLRGKNERGTWEH